jgi:hypothetical protein
MSRPGVYADWQVCLDLFMPTDTVIPHTWSAADIVGEALPALSFLCYTRYDTSLDLISEIAEKEGVSGQPRGTFSETGPSRKKTKKTFRKLYKLRSLSNKTKYNG